MAFIAIGVIVAVFVGIFLYSAFTVSKLEDEFAERIYQNYIESDNSENNKNEGEK